MFDIGLGEMLALGIIAVIVFGPEKLPKVAADAARMLHQFRKFAQGAKEDIKRELGPDLDGMHLDDLNPRTFVRKNLLGDDDFGLGDLKNDLKVDAGPSSLSSKPWEQPPRLKSGERPPYDADAT